MIAKIGHGANLIGALSYNLTKVNQQNGTVLLAQKIAESPLGTYSVGQFARSFEPYLVANKRTEKPVVHISLNPNPRNTVSDDLYCRIASDYMEVMGYTNQPYVVFKHTDIERVHIHIVTSCVAADGKKITDSFERRRSMKACRDLEQKYGLIPATEKELRNEAAAFKPVKYRKGNVKGQIAAVVRYLPHHYKCQSLGGYNALLSLFNIKAEQISGETCGKPKEGLIYFSLEERNKIGPPFKASLFGKHAGMEQLWIQFEKNRIELKDHSCKKNLKEVIRSYKGSCSNAATFKQGLLAHGINTVLFTNEHGRVYGISFIDHASKTVWNGSQLGKEFSANAFEEHWNLPPLGYHLQDRKQEPNEEAPGRGITTDWEGDDYGNFFSFLGGLLPLVRDDYEEVPPQTERKKRKKRKKGKQ